MKSKRISLVRLGAEKFEGEHQRAAEFEERLKRRKNLRMEGVKHKEKRERRLKVHQA